MIVFRYLGVMSKVKKIGEVSTVSIIRGIKIAEVCLLHKTLKSKSSFFKRIITIYYKK